MKINTLIKSSTTSWVQIVLVISYCSKLMNIYRLMFCHAKYLSCTTTYCRAQIGYIRQNSEFNCVSFLLMKFKIKVIMRNIIGMPEWNYFWVLVQKKKYLMQIVFVSLLSRANFVDLQIFCFHTQQKIQPQSHAKTTLPNTC